MTVKLKKIKNQTIVITGATSGIGLTTARMAAEKGAKLVLVARNEDALEELTDEINSSGGKAIYTVADVADEDALKQAAEKAKNEFGGFDTWVNNAGGSIYGRIADVPTEDLRQLFETNVWGVVNGSKIALEHLRGRGGAIINLGSEVSDAPIPLQGMYSASKHAVKGFTDALRMEIEGDELPISVTLIKPTAIHTPFPENAKNYLPYKPQLPPPVYAPELVAEAILYSAEKPKRDFYIGGMAKAHSSLAENAPRLYDKMNEMIINSAQSSGKPAPADDSDGLYETNSKLHERGEEDRFVIEHSLYQESNLHPYLSTALAIGGGVGIAWLLNSLKSADGGTKSPKDGDSKIYSTDIKKHSKVVGSDGAHIGTVDGVEYGEIKLTRKDSSDGKHHFIPVDSVKSFEENKVILSQTAEQTQKTWRVGDDNKTDLSAKSAGGAVLSAKSETARNDDTVK